MGSERCDLLLELGYVMGLAQAEHIALFALGHKGNMLYIFHLYNDMHRVCDAAGGCYWHEIVEPGVTPFRYQATHLANSDLNRREGMTYTTCKRLLWSMKHQADNQEQR